jgi:phage protein U
MAFAILGDIHFEVVAGPTSLSSQSASQFAEHPLIGGRPRLQFTGHDLEELSVQFGFHKLFCDPTKSLGQLKAAKAAHQAMALVLGNGEYKGYFVITALSTDMQHTGPDGTPIYLQATMTLREFTGDPAAPLQPPAVSPAGKAPAGASATAPAAPMTAKAKASILVTAASGGLASAATALRIAQGLRSNPLKALAQVPTLLGSLGRVSDTLTQLYPALDGLGSALQNGGVVMGGVSDTANFVQQGVNQLQSASGADAPNRIDNAAGLLDSGQFAWRGIAPSFGGLAAQTGTRAA